MNLKRKTYRADQQQASVAPKRLAQEREGITMNTTNVESGTALIGVGAPKGILQSVLAALNEGKISKAVDQFDEHFTFTDHALDLEFTDKDRLIEFFQKTREFFPDTMVEIESSFQCGDHAVAEWKLTGTTQSVPYGSSGFRPPISLRGTSIVRTENGRIADWSDYYDKNRSWRVSLAAFFTDWIEY
jgi:steroid delta-isomerase-like uncharacterized protein